MNVSQAAAAASSIVVLTISRIWFRRCASVYVGCQGAMVAHGTPDEMRASKDPLVRQFVWGEADGPVTSQYPSRSFSAELDLV